MALNNLKAIMKQPVVNGNMMDEDKPPALLKRKPFGNMTPKIKQPPMGLAARLTGGK